MTAALLSLLALEITAGDIVAACALLILIVVAQFRLSHALNLPCPTLAFACSNNSPRRRACWRTVCFMRLVVSSMSLRWSLICFANSASDRVGGGAGLVSASAMTFSFAAGGCSRCQTAPRSLRGLFTGRADNSRGDPSFHITQPVAN